MTQPTKKEHYDFAIPEEGLSYDILDMAFNPSTQHFIEASNVRAGMKVLEVGCGSGVMTHYLAQKVGQQGEVVAIDNSEAQLARAMRYCDSQGTSNITFQHLSLFDIEKLQTTFDVIYCRFVLHHVDSPRQAIQLFYKLLNSGGIYIAEEGIISAAFSYPPYSAWWHKRELPVSPDKTQDGVGRDGEFGMKLFYWMKKAGFTVQDIKLIQPVFTAYEQKIKLLDGHDSYKKTALLHGKTETEWQDERDNLICLAKDEEAMVGFYQSCQVRGIKP